jgi:hypothetical protein
MVQQDSLNIELTITIPCSVENMLPVGLVAYGHHLSFSGQQNQWWVIEI